MIRRFRHKGLQRFFETGSKARIQASHVTRLRAQLARLDKAVSPQDMDLPNWRLHPLKGKLAGRWAVWVDANWRLTFMFEGEDADLVDYQDYH
ncbi:MAG: type II toxin-antitoxin system RelE/ParE family toxin [Deltaproteobacteria bacterium]|nr:type II toxin-antitoxin system RelE/ParE family toxin [Deltaproteobacteria bacterium]